MINSIAPSRIEPFGETEMLLAFKSSKSGAGGETENGSNGIHEEEYAVPYVELRFNCPCASCVDEHTGERTIHRDQIKPTIRPTGVQLVGRYAVQISWNDRHSTGMYHFDRLYQLSQKQGRRLK
jgi:DUF971 family protein